MRTIFYFISFYFFLFGLGNNFSCSSQHLQLKLNDTDLNFNNHSRNFKTKECSFAAIEFTDIELEENCHNDDPVDHSSSLNLVNNYLTNWQSYFSAFFVAYCHLKYNPTNISLGLLSSPIYLKNNVFRI